MASLGIIALVASVLGTLSGLLGAPVRIRDIQGDIGLESRTRHTTESFKGHASLREGPGDGDWAGRHLGSASHGHPNSIALVDTRKPMSARLGEYFTMPEHHFANWLELHGGRQNWKASESEQERHGDLTARRRLHPHEFPLEFDEYREGVQPEPLLAIQGMGEDAAQFAAPTWRSPSNSYEFSVSGGRKHRAKRSCVLRRINRFLQRLQRFTGRGIVGDLIKAAGGIQGQLQFYRIAPNPAGAEGVGVSFRAGTRNWSGFREGESTLGTETPVWGGVTRGGTTLGAETTAWSGVPRGRATNNNPGAYGNPVDTENIGSVDNYNGE